MNTRIWCTAGILALVPAVAAGQEAAPQEPAKTKPKLSWLQRMIVDRMAQQLGLDEAQKAQVVAIIVDTEAKKKKLDEAQNTRIKALLSAEQQKQYDAMRQSFERGWGGGRGAGRGAGGGAAQDPANSPQMKELTELLKLDDAQQAKIAELSRQAMEKGRERGRKIWEQIQKGEFDWSKLDAVFAEFFDDYKKQVHPVLRPDQRSKFDQWLGELQTQMSDPSQWGTLQQRWSGGGDGRGGGRRWTAASSGPSLGRILRDLDLSEDERLVLEPSIKRILDLDRRWRRDARTHGRTLRREAGSEGVESVKAALEAAREARRKYEGDRRTAERELRDLVTLAQEAVLVSHGVLK